MELWQKYIVKSGGLNEMASAYAKLRKVFQKLGFTESDIRKPSYYTRDMFVYRDELNYIMIKLKKELELYGFEVGEKEFNEFIQNKLSKVDLEYPLKNEKHGDS